MDVKAKEQKVVKNFKRNEMIGFGSFLAITSSMVLTVYEYPSFAAAGWSVILFLVVAGACFFLPIAMAAAEMGTVRKWEKKGIYIWVSQTLGRRWGFYAIFFQWLAICDAFLAMLYFVVSGLGFVFGGVTGMNLLTIGGTALNGNQDMIQVFTLNDITDTTVAYWQQKNDVINEINNMQGVYSSHQNIVEIGGAIFGVAVLLFLAITGSQLFGVKWTGRIAKVGFWGGIGVPTLIIVILGCMYVAQGHYVHNYGSQDTLANGDLGPVQGAAFTRGEAGSAAIFAFVTVVLAFIGPEGSGTLANNLKNVERNYPIAVFVLMMMSVGFSALAGTFIAISTEGNINQTGGISIALVNMMILTTNISVQGSMAFARVVLFFICLGIIAQLCSWIVGPVNGLKAAAERNLLPKLFAKENKYQIPLFNIGIQTIIVIILEAIVSLGLGMQGGSAFSVGISITVIVYLLAYWLMWIGYIRMMIKAPNLPRAFKVKYPWVSIMIGVIGIICSLIGWCASWVNNAGVGNGTFYGVLCGISLAMLVFTEVMYDSYYLYKKSLLLKKYGFNYNDYPSIALGEAKRLFLVKLAEQKVPEMAEYEKVELKPATAEELEEDRRIRLEEKQASNSKSRSFFRKKVSQDK